MASIESSGSGRARLVAGPSSTSLIIGIAVFAACVLGILTRPTGLLAMIWPANAVMLGLLVRMPDARGPSVWLAAAAAYVAADLTAGTDITKALLLNATNLCGVGAGYLVCRCLPDNALRMREPASALYIVLVSAAAAAATGLAGAITDPRLLRMGAVNAGMLWFVTELVNYIALLPVIFSAPNPRSLIPEIKSLSLTSFVRGAAPAAALAPSCALATAVGGPGAIAFAVPALLWCGLVYPVFAVSVLTFLFACWSLTVMAAAYLPDIAGVYDAHMMVSIRLAAFMIALAPVTLSIVMRNRDELVRKLSLARQRIDMAMDAGGIVATWNLNFTESDLAVEGEFLRLFEIDDKSGSGIFHDNLANLIHPDDRERVYDALGTAIATDTDYQCRYRIVTPGGEIRWFAAFGKPVRDGKGAASRLIGILIDVTEQTEAAEVLEQSNMRFNIVSESIPQIVWSTDPKGRHDYFNYRWTEFTGIAQEDIRPETWEYLVHPEDKPRVDETWGTCLATGATYAIDYRFRYHDGGYRWLRVLAKPLRNADGEITRWYGTSTDIDDAKQLEAEREIVARELDHRIGNLFALVNGLVGLAARDGSDVRAMAEALRSRLSALHDAHGLIRRNRDGASVTMAELLWRLLAPYDNGAGRITIAGDDLPVDPSATTSIALIFHELATNAVKYGALSDCQSRLRIEFSRIDDRFNIRWLEVCRSCAAAGRGTGFGSRLFDSIVEGQLRGKAARSLSHEGLTIDIELPVSSLTGSAKRQ
jgi:PAS domain S-box-containing protein